MSEAADTFIEAISGTSDGEQYLTFTLNEQKYAIDILKVQGIQGWDSCTALPNTPEYILGVINLRGAIVLVIDMRIRFAMNNVGYNDLTVVIVVKVNCGDTNKVVGLVVDAVSEVCNISKNELSATPDFGVDVDIQFLDGLATVGEKLIIALNVDKLIGEGEFKQIQAA